MEHEVVLPDGQIVIANEQSHPDLFWALRGGGGGTFGVVTRVTMKTHEAVSTNGFLLTIMPGFSTKSGEKFTDAVAYFITQMPKLTDSGVTGFPVIRSKNVYGEFIAPAKTADEVNKVMQPIFAEVRKRGATVVSVPIGGLNIKVSDTVGVTYTMGSRLVSRKALKNIDSVKSILKTLQNEDVDLSQPFPVAGGQVSRNRNLNVSVHPAWRDAVIHWVINKKRDAKSSPTDMRKFYTSFTDTSVKILDSMSEPSASYLNEVSQS